MWCGDRYRIGSAVFEVTQPRVTCYRVRDSDERAKDAGIADVSGEAGVSSALEEGEVGGGDEIVKVPEVRMTVAEINALLYSPNHPRDQLEMALRIEHFPRMAPVLEALLRSGASGNAGLAPAAAAHPAATGFERWRGSAIDEECADVFSLTLRSPDGQPLPPALAGQYVVVRLQRTAGGPPLYRSYSLSVRRSVIESA